VTRAPLSSARPPPLDLARRPDLGGSWLAAGRAGAIHATAETLQKMKVGITGVTYTRKFQRLLTESSGWMAE